MPKRSDRGFTIMELMIGLAIFSIIAVTIYQSLHSGIQIWRRGNESMSYNQSLRLFYSQADTDAANYIPFALLPGEWTGDHLSFACLVKSSTAEGTVKEIARVTYRFDPEKKVLERLEALGITGFNAERSKRRTLLENAGNGSFKFCYFTQGQGYDWRDGWTAVDKTPRAVKIVFDITDKRGLSPEHVEKIIFMPMGEMGKQQ